MTENHLLESALNWAKWGVAVFPCQPRTKIPLTRNGFWDASTDESVIRAWWAATPSANIGAVPGSGGFCAIDVDGAAGRAAIDAYLKVHDVPTADLVTKSPGRGGGYHLWYKLPAGMEYVPSQYLTADKGLQVRAHGGYVMVPPSVHPDGPAYKYLRGDPADKTDLTQFPPGVLRSDREVGAQRSMVEVRELLKSAPQKPTEYARKQVEQYAELLKDPGFTPEGQRHAAMLEYTYQLAAGLIGGRNTLDDAAGLREAYIEACYPWPVQADFDSALYGALCKIDRDPELSEGRKFKVLMASDTKMRKAVWLWEEKIPFGDFSLLAGREGIGKSTITHWIAAQVSKGLLPGTLRGTPRSVLYVSTEDAWDVKTVPCLAAAGADLARVGHLEMTGRNWVTSMALPDDLGELYTLAAEMDAALIVFDPLVSRLSKGLDTHKDADVKNALEPLIGFAQDTGVAVLGLAHVNKSKDSDLTTSIMGSRAFVASPRAVLFAAKMDVGYGMSVVKANYGPANESTDLYALEKVTVRSDGITGMRVAWNESPAMESLSDLVKGGSGGRETAADWLRNLLVSGPLTKPEVLAAAQGTYKDSTLGFALKEIGGESVRKGNGPATWSLTLP